MDNTCAGAPDADVPPHYRRGSPRAPHQRRRHRAILRLLKLVHGRVLDYGCGYGDITYSISKSHAVVGVDVDPERVAFAVKEYAPLSFMQCEPNSLPFTDACFDIVTSVAVIHFASDPRAYLEQAKRVLRPAGHLVIACINRPVIRDGWRRLFGKQPVPSRLWLPPKHEFRKLLEQVGFQIKQEDWFYDPPLEGWRNARDIFLGIVHQALSLFRIAPTANYYLFLATKAE